MNDDIFDSAYHTVFGILALARICLFVPESDRPAMQFGTNIDEFFAGFGGRDMIVVEPTFIAYSYNMIAYRFASDPKLLERYTSIEGEKEWARRASEFLEGAESAMESQHGELERLFPRFAKKLDFRENEVVFYKETQSDVEVYGTLPTVGALVFSYYMALIYGVAVLLVPQSLDGWSEAVGNKKRTVH